MDRENQARQNLIGYTDHVVMGVLAVAIAAMMVVIKPDAFSFTVAGFLALCGLALLGWVARDRARRRH